MNDAANQAYAERIQRVIDYVNTHLGESLSLDDLSRVANFSKFHFHRQFSEYTGMTVFQLIHAMRLKRAAYQLAFRDLRIIDIALDAGFENPESFSRAFKKTFAQTPSQFRKAPAWQPWQEKYSIIPHIGTRQMPVEIVEFEEVKIGVLEHHGAPDRLNESLKRFIEWRKENKLSPNISRTFNLVYDNPKTAVPENFRLDICAEIKWELKPNAYGVVSKVIPGGRCARLRHLGSSDTLEQSAHFLYGEWLPSSGEELRNFPLFFERLNLFPDVAEHELITDIYLPLK